GRPTKLIMTSKDVVHAFYIPDCRAKMDVIPNRYTSIWFEPLHPTEVKLDASGKPLLDAKKHPIYNDHHVFCAEYCGDNHSDMAAYIRVLPDDEFDRLKEEYTNPPEGTPEEHGKFYWEKKFGCKTCHSIDGSKGTGPTWKNMYGFPVEVTEAGV